MIINLEILLQNQRIIDHQVKESINSLVVLCRDPNLKQSFDAAIEHASLKQTEIDDTPVIDVTKVNNVIKTLCDINNRDAPEETPILELLTPNCIGDFNDFETAVKYSLTLCINSCDMLTDADSDVVRKKLSQCIDYCRVLNVVDALITGINSSISELLALRVVIRLTKSLDAVEEIPHRAENISKVSTNIFNKDFDWISTAKGMINTDKK